MRHPAGQLADHFQLLRLAQQSFGAFTLHDLVQHGGMGAFQFSGAGRNAFLQRGIDALQVILGQSAGGHVG